MTYTFNSTGWIAVFGGTETEPARSVPVEGWDSTTGVALVVDPQLGKMRAVTDWPDFSHLEQTRRAIAAIPGGGWRLRHGDGTEPVLAWLIAANGQAAPIMIDASHAAAPVNPTHADRVVPPEAD
ncbi:hypothetical protein [Herbidospora sp. NBRC 101105]|uniref:hypothetical protein n=1 Tax=Herbidospora sp. NBRC 101105 TaxID=3032195 RepID=UPI0024A3393E|nr:hypothetical protein [Herbidospora sp. NBRC 101105]GLX96443.1 hypothetical protein Hesp01_43930 [Herbidospora sp. NBRC 101105]